MLKRGQRAERTATAAMSIDRGFVLNRMKPRFGPRLARSTRSKASDSIARSRSPSSQRAFLDVLARRSHRRCRVSRPFGVSRRLRRRFAAKRDRLTRTRDAHLRTQPPPAARAADASLVPTLRVRRRIPSLILYWTAPLSKTRLPTTASTSCSLGALGSRLGLGLPRVTLVDPVEALGDPAARHGALRALLGALELVTISFRV